MVDYTIEYKELTEYDIKIANSMAIWHAVQEIRAFAEKWFMEVPIRTERDIKRVFREIQSHNICKIIEDIAPDMQRIIKNFADTLREYESDLIDVYKYSTVYMDEWKIKHFYFKNLEERIVFDMCSKSMGMPMLRLAYPYFPEHIMLGEAIKTLPNTKAIITAKLSIDRATLEMIADVVNMRDKSGGYGTFIYSDDVDYILLSRAAKNLIPYADEYTGFFCDHYKKMAVSDIWDKYSSKYVFNFLWTVEDKYDMMQFKLASYMHDIHHGCKKCIDLNSGDIWYE